MEGTSVGVRCGEVVHVGCCCVRVEYMGKGWLCGGSAERGNAGEES